MTTRLHRGDLPDLSRYGKEVAIDTETMGLDPRRDRLCVVQLSPGDGSADVVQIPPGPEGSAQSRKAAEPIPPSPRSSITRASTWPCSSIASASSPGRSGAPRSPASWCAPIPIATASRTWPANCSTSTCPSSSKARTGAPTRSPTPSSTTPPPTCSTCTTSSATSTACCAARADSSWPKPASASCPPASSSTCWAGTKQDIFAHS